MKNEFIQTDDNQYVRKISDGVYRLVEARWAESQWIVCTDKVIITNWLDSDGKYDSVCADRICSYYSSVGEFESCYLDIKYREQVLAEILFEETDHREIEHTMASDEELQDVLDKFMKKYIGE